LAALCSGDLAVRWHRRIGPDCSTIDRSLKHQLAPGSGSGLALQKPAPSGRPEAVADCVWRWTTGPVSIASRGRLVVDPVTLTCVVLRWLFVGW